eukprot:TRINITY_DN2125_c0_g1_i1.p1 TRINITY_DN2125_c0_g1~~TRINITY_DN2125_c0_g1_i1.p1  ORF type:complete len:163 (-),score=58.65 TRINITY_DN2125_c0_g1_i1:77-565(-)
MALELFSNGNWSAYSMIAAWVLAFFPHVLSVLLIGKSYNNASPRSTFSNADLAESKEKKGVPSKERREMSQRAEWASLNGLEGLSLFYAAILGGHLAQLPVASLNQFAGVYLGLRVAFIFLYVTTPSGQQLKSTLRSLVWTASVGYSLYILYQVAQVLSARV